MVSTSVVISVYDDNDGDDDAGKCTDFRKLRARGSLRASTATDAPAGFLANGANILISAGSKIANR